MALCALCAVVLPDAVGEQTLCTHHHAVKRDDWAIGNFVVCEYVHRGLLHPELAVPEPEPVPVTYADVA